MSSLHASGGDHRGPMRHESLMPTHHDHDQDSTWMIGYLDIMTLLVALMVLIFTLSSFGRPGDEAAPLATRVPFAIPLPSEMTQALPLAAMPRPVPGRLSQSAISAALGVAGLPRRLTPAPSERIAFAAPTPLALLAQREPPPLMLPTLVANGSVPTSPADFALVLTDRPPNGVREITPQAVAATKALQETLSARLDDAPYLADLEGVEVSRVAEGIKLRVEDRLLFPTATAELSDDGEALIQRLMEVIQRHDGEVAVEGHTDSRAIRTEEFPSNWVLSSARAIAIVHALERSGVDSQRLRAVGLADTRPLASNDTGEGRAQNRRVEVIIHAR
ncbi:OmpA family protein [Halomonas sp. MCCC 1A17488]|uniref:OmpA family protein n=1 Tax=unclassified Halomonas TaxID=2609666 RepID=UPI0018D220D3|nr:MULTISPECIES: OmpA family protein [unclassified Halomonas]MCE8014804.1 OmpA family protein [Halomonas sp. MCCC 1A17488]MCG3238137.1 OmpA family protein [Halomonas sp. MCCC 1A17488]QPP48095.1 OmpA family protein [Halomonas sp. SS10-MC5]